MRVLCTHYTLIDQGFVGEHFDQLIWRRIGGQHTSKNAPRRFHKKLTGLRGVRMIGEETLRDKLSLRSVNVFAFSVDFSRRTPVTRSCIQRVQNNVAAGVVMALGKFAGGVVTNEGLKASATPYHRQEL